MIAHCLGCGTTLWGETPTDTLDNQWCGTCEPNLPDRSGLPGESQISGILAKSDPELMSQWALLFDANDLEDFAHRFAVMAFTAGYYYGRRPV